MIIMIRIASVGDVETVNHISKCSKLVQKKYKTNHNWVGKGVNWELCKKLKFDHSTK